MQNEVKVRIKNWKNIEERLKSLGAIFINEEHVEDIYYNQPKGKVLKLSIIDGIPFLLKLKANSGGFKILSKTRVDNIEETKLRLADIHGIDTILKKKARHFRFEKYLVSLNLIEDIGEFLIMTGTDVNKNIIRTKLQIEAPEVITVPFNQL